MSALPPDLWSSLAVETPRLVLRPLVPADAPALRAITDDPAVAPFVSFLAQPFGLDDARALIARNGEGATERFLGIVRDDALVGVIGAHAHAPVDDRPAVEIGYWLAAGARGAGYAREAARGLVARLRALAPEAIVVAEVTLENAASRRLLGDIGFVPAGTPGKRPGRKMMLLL
ncbi:GNAT family N-acetyltransferase [Salinarimonas rosea]|uniref:GNAT family N-acetyltransferase n=1 Tax=Salinarimonas rosea TaxID=552063 RepID=UPI000402286B|nr:GNAT family N-acetyltransferase [Salinarimonas rosea]